MKMKISAVLLCVAVLLGLTACGGGAGPNVKAPEQTAGKLKVSVTFNAMREFTYAVGKDKVEISTIIPDGTEPHDFEPKAKELAALSSAKVFVYNGLGMENWAEDAIKAANNPGLISVEASKGVDVIEITDEPEGEEHGEHDHGKFDPHTWLSIKCAEVEVKNIKDALVKADPANKDYYEKNYSDYVAQLEYVYKTYSDKLKTATKKSFVTGHAAFAYLCRDFGLTQNSVEDVFAEGEPSAQQLTELVKYCHTNGVTTVFAEELASPAVSETLAKEVGAKVETIYTIESAEDGKTYLDRMKDNLDRICASLK